MRRAARQDGNHGSIVAAFKALGCVVQDLSGVGGGCPDVVVGVGRFNVLAEIKDPQQPPSARAFTSDQKRWHKGWTGTAHVVETEFDAEELVKYYRALGRILAKGVA